MKLQNADSQLPWTLHVIVQPVSRCLCRTCSALPRKRAFACKLLNLSRRDCTNTNNVYTLALKDWHTHTTWSHSHSNGAPLLLHTDWPCFLFALHWHSRSPLVIVDSCTYCYSYSCCCFIVAVFCVTHLTANWLHKCSWGVHRCVFCIGIRAVCVSFPLYFVLILFLLQFSAPK